MGIGVGKSASKSKQTQNTTETTTPNVPDWISNSVQGQNSNISNLASMDPNSFVAGVSPNQQAAYDGALKLGGNAGMFGDAAGLINQGAGPQQVQQVTGLDNIANFMNPYTDQVVNTTLAGQDQAAASARAQLAAKGALSGAFGGSRFGLADSNLVAQQGLDRASVEANLRNTGFNTAAGLTQQANLSNQGAVNTAAQSDLLRKLQAGGMLGDLAVNQGADARATVGTQLATGESQHSVLQDQAGAPLSVAQIISQLYGNIPYQDFIGQTANTNGVVKTKGTTTSATGSFGK